MIKRVIFVCTILVMLLAVSCEKNPITIQTTPTSIKPVISQIPTLEPTSVPTITQIPPTPTQTLVNRFWSPLKGIGLDELRLVTSQEFNKPTPFIESGHPALDFSFYQYREFTTFERFPIQAILPGKVILVIHDRWPYGNMILIETQLDQISPGLLKTIPIPTSLPAGSYSLDARCPTEGVPVTWSLDSESIYTLYAHLSESPELSPGDLIPGGQQIAFAGKTGNAVEPHLHLEVRVGPSSAAFGVISTYHSTSTPAERYNYCIWALSGVFQAVDPAKLLYPTK